MGCGSSKQVVEEPPVKKVRERKKKPPKKSGDGGDGGDGGQPENDKTMRAVAASILEATRDMGPWKISDLTAGLYFLRKKHMREAAEAVETGEHPYLAQSPVKDRKALKRMAKWARVAVATYSNADDVLCEAMGWEQDQILASDWKSVTQRPGYFLARVPAEKKIVLGIRGTAKAADAITDAAAATEPCLDGVAHRGIYTAAQWFMANLFDDIIDAIEDEEDEEYTVMTVGHSLGGGTAALVAMLLHEEDIDVEAVVLAPACTVDLESAQDCADYVTTIVNANDVVPRASTRAMINLRQEVKEHPWQKEAAAALGETRVGKAVSAAATAAGSSRSGKAAAKGSRAAASAGKKAAGKGAAAGKSAGKAVGKVAGKATGAVRPRGSGRRGGQGGSGGRGAREVTNLYPPGTVYHIVDLTGKPELFQVSNDTFADITLAKSMLTDHSSDLYLEYLEYLAS